ncbi:MAG: type 4a pilus biogenesis protein PilO [Phycisphaerales bacterium]|nr:MAG: type 4a pilus biogenesis protein PilO [Phycisphaerales bacterium]
MVCRSRQQITICAIGAAIVCVFMVFWYLPLRRQMNAIKQARTERAMAIAKGTADAKRLPLIEEQLRDLQRRSGDSEAGVPEQRSLGEFMQIIADLMKGYDLKDDVVTPGVEIEADKFHCIPVNMQCKGELSQISEFYRRLQSLDRLVRIEQVKLTNDENYSGQVTMETEAVVYYRTQVEKPDV